MPKLELNLSVIDADKVIAEMRELRDEARRSHIYATILFVATGIVATGVVVFVGR